MADPTLDGTIAWCENVAEGISGVPTWPSGRAERFAALAAHLRRLLALDAAVQRVRAMHAKEHGQNGWAGVDDHCAHCEQDNSLKAPWPCDTIRALDAGGGA